MLKDNCDIDDKVIMPLESKRMKVQLTIKLMLRKPTTTPQYITKMKEVIKITKNYPEFKLNQQVQEGIIPQLKVGENVAPKEVKTSNPQPAKKTQNVSKNTTKSENVPQMTAPKGNPNDEKFKTLSAADKNDPDAEVNYICSISALTYKIQELETKIKNIEGRTPKELRTKLVSFKCKKNIFENAVGDGSLTAKQVFELLQGQIDKDKLLLEYFNSIGDKDKSNIVNKRLPYLMKDLKDLKDMVK